MIFFALAVWACCFAAEIANSKFAPVTRFVPPWNFPQLEVADNCTILCGRWNALYLSVEYGCVGRDHARLAYGDDGTATGKVSFCPDKSVIKTWTVDEELEFEAVYLIIEELEKSELDVFNEMALEREMKLSAHPWHMLLQEEIDIPQDRRRTTMVDGSSTDWSCFGGNGGGPWIGYQGSRPIHLICRHGWYIDRFEFAFADAFYTGNNWLRGGGFGGGMSSTSLPDCIDYIIIRAGKYIDAIRFFGGEDYTPYFGGSGGALYALFAPSGKCLGDIQMKTGRLVDKICFKFTISK